MAGQYKLFPPSRPTHRRPAYRQDSVPTIQDPFHSRSKGSDSSIESFPAFDSSTFEACLDSFFTMDQGSLLHADSLYFQLQASQESLLHGAAPVSRKPSVLLPECNLVKPYSQRPRVAVPEKPLPPTPLQPHQRTRKRTNRSVTASQLEQLSRAVSPTPSGEWSGSSTLQGSFSSTVSTTPSLTFSETRSPRSTMSRSPYSTLEQPTRQRRKVSFTDSTTNVRDTKSVPLPLHLIEPSRVDNMAYVPVELSPTFPACNLLPSPDLISAFPSLPSSPTEPTETSGWEPDSDDDETTRTLRKKISRKFTVDRASRPSSRSISEMVPMPKKHCPRPSDSSTLSTTSYATTAAQRASRSTAHSSLSQSTTLLKDSTLAAVCAERDARIAQRLNGSPSIVSIPGKKKVKFGHKLRGWLGRASC